MKKKLVVLLSFTALLGTLVGCGDITVSHKASDHSRSIRNTQGIDEFCLALDGGYRINHSDTSYHVTSNRDYPKENIYNVTPSALSKITNDIQVFSVDGYGLFFYYREEGEVHRLDYGSIDFRSVVAMDLVDYGVSEGTFIMMWIYNDSLIFQSLEAFDISEKLTLHIWYHLVNEDNPPLTCYINGHGCYIEDQRVVCSQRKFSCPTLFENVDPFGD